MQTEPIYTDIIEDKIKEWQGKIEILKTRSENAPVDQRIQLETRINQLRAALETATLQLHELNKSENRDNTLLIKEDILKIFDSVDKDLKISDEKTPYML